MFRLNEEQLTENLNYFLCDYGENQYKSILTDENYRPESFTVYQKMQGDELIYFRDMLFEDWVNNLIADQACKITDVRDIAAVKSRTFENVMFLLNFKVRGKELAKNIYNQEFVDIIRRVMYFTLYGRCDSDLYTAKIFNELAYSIMPLVIDIIDGNNYDLHKIFKLSVASGLAGLDMKGAPSAASGYANEGIPMTPYFRISPNAAARDLLEGLEKIIKESDTPVFYWESFIGDIQRADKITWMTDDYIETFLDLYFIQRITEVYTDIHVDIIPKNGRFGNDMSWMDLEEIIKLPIFSKIMEKIKDDKISVNHFGPQMGAVNLFKLSDQCVESIRTSDFVVAKGCRIHEMIQGGIDKKVFSAYIVTRELSEIVTGFDSRHTPILLLCAQPGEYLFWGMSYENAKNVYLDSDKKRLTCYCTIKDHEKRKSLSSIETIVNEYNDIYSCLKSYSTYSRPVCLELEHLKNYIDCFTKKNYSFYYKKFGEIHTGLNEFDQRTWSVFVQAVNRYFDSEFSRLSVLEVAAGSGKDLSFGNDMGFKMTGCDNCLEFVNEFNRKNEGKGPLYIYGDAYHLPFDNESFHVVRQNASLVHMPMIEKGYGVDIALSESNRVLKKSGLLYLLVKKGDGLNIVDTGEALGKRVFQYYHQKDIERILERNNFRILSMDVLEEERMGTVIPWIVCISMKSE